MCLSVLSVYITSTIPSLARHEDQCVVSRALLKPVHSIVVLEELLRYHKNAWLILCMCIKIQHFTMGMMQTKQAHKTPTHQRQNHRQKLQEYLKATSATTAEKCNLARLPHLDDRGSCMPGYNTTPINMKY